jgi:hypothetical protein
LNFYRLCKLEKRGDEKFLFLVMAAILDKEGADGHNFERGPPKDHFSKVWLKLAH